MSKITRNQALLAKTQFKQEWFGAQDILGVGLNRGADGNWSLNVMIKTGSRTRLAALPHELNGVRIQTEECDCFLAM